LETNYPNSYIRSVLKKYRNEIWSPFIRAVNEYKLIADGDKIAVCVSGGKDSFCLALCMKELQRQSVLAKREKYEVIFLCMNPGYSRASIKKIKDNAKLLGLPLIFFKSNIFDVVSKAGGSPCYLCARMRRGNLYAAAQKQGCSKIALAHHFDDVIETTMMNLLYNGKIKTMPPKLNSTNWKNMQLIRPFVRVRERNIIKWREDNSLEFINCACPLTENACNLHGSKTGKRNEIKMLLSEIEDSHANAPINIFNALNTTQQ
jgi:tRNA(Ile)-lysidine synthase TilS/MesJ